MQKVGLARDGVPFSLALTLEPGEHSAAVPAIGPLAEELGIADRVFFLGRCDRDTITRLYQLASLLVSSSHAESFGYPTVEATIEGCPVVASSIPASVELLGNAAASYFPPGDVAALAAAVRRFAANPVRIPEKLAGDFRARYSWNDYGRRVRRVIDSVQ